MNDFKSKYPEFAAIEGHIRRARIERSVAVAQVLAEGIVGTARGLRKIGAALANIKVGKPAGPVATH